MLLTDQVATAPVLTQSKYDFGLFVQSGPKDQSLYFDFTNGTNDPTFEHDFIAAFFIQPP